MQGGAEFKPFADLLVPDASSTVYQLFDPASEEGFRPREFADTYAAMNELSLPASIPSAVRGYYDATRMMWVYGWFYYPFYTWAAFHAATCVEMGLRLRLKEQGHPLPKRSPSLARMLRHAAHHGWLRLDNYSRFRDVAESGEYRSSADLAAMLDRFLNGFRWVRNWHAHPGQFAYLMPGHGYDSICFAHDTLRQLFGTVEPDTTAGRP